MNILWRFILALFVMQSWSIASAAETAYENTWGIYTVVEGDSLWKIAQKHPGATVASLAEANHITNPNVIYPNTKLIITANHLVSKPAPKKSIVKKVKPMEASAPCVPVTSCNALRAIDRLGYPENVRKLLKEAVSREVMVGQANAKHLDVVGASYSTREGNVEYTFIIARKCTYKKIVRTLTGPTKSAHETPSAPGVGGIPSPAAKDTSLPEKIPIHSNDNGEKIAGFTVLMRYKPESSRLTFRDFWGKITHRTTKKKGVTSTSERH